MNMNFNKYNMAVLYLAFVLNSASEVACNLTSLLLFSDTATPGFSYFRGSILIDDVCSTVHVHQHCKLWKLALFDSKLQFVLPEILEIWRKGVNITSFFCGIILLLLLFIFCTP